MRYINRIALLVVLVLTCSFLISLPLKKISAEESGKFFQKDFGYDIYYVLQDSAQCVVNVKIVGLVEIYGASFMQVQPSNFPQEKSGYILFSSIRSILPTGTPQPITK
jgi:hypothetical protein